MKIYYRFVMIVCVLFSTTTAIAQTTQATISGIVSDQAANALPGATVTVKNESTGFSTGTQTNAQGDFLFKQLPLGGPYTVTVSFIGYAENRQTGFVLHQGDAIRVKTALQES